MTWFTAAEAVRPSQVPVQLQLPALQVLSLLPVLAGQTACQQQSATLLQGKSLRIPDLSADLPERSAQGMLQPVSPAQLQAPLQGQSAHAL